MTSITTGPETVVRIAAHDPDAGIRDALAGTDCRVAEVGSTGVSGLEPLVTVTRDGRTAYHTQCTPDRAATIAAGLDSDDDLGVDADAVVDHEPETATLPVPDLPGVGAGVRRVLGGCGWRRPTSPTDHRAAGGFSDPDPDAVWALGDDLLGRGWGDWCHDTPIAEAWTTARDADGAATVVVNAHSNRADTLLLESAPFEVLDGANAVGRAVEADRTVVYASADDERAVARVREAAEQYPEPAAPIEVLTGPPPYRAAEPTMAIEAIEGNHRLEARLRPPGPDEVGIHGRPTLVHSARTVAHLAVSVRADDRPETRLLHVTGDVADPVTLEVPETDTLGVVRDAVDLDGSFKAACVGGRFGGITASLDVAAAPGALEAADLGTEGIVQLVTDDRCLLEFVGKRARFAAEENCGRCVPCREGTTQLAELLRGIYDGEYDREKIEELVRVMDASSICEFGVNAGRPARTAMAEFDTEFAAHADGRCPAGSCLERMEVTH